MSISRDRFDHVKSRWGAHASWAVWQPVGDGQKPKSNVGDRAILDPDLNPELLEQLKPEVIMVGLNAATRPIDAEPWSNFHDGRSVANDFKLRAAFEGTPYWGAYMTDVLVRHETDSRVVSTWVNENPQTVLEQIGRFKNELIDIGARNPLVIAFGHQSYRLLRKNVPELRRVVRVTHYAHYVSQADYRQTVLDTIQRHLEAGFQ